MRYYQTYRVKTQLARVEAGTHNWQGSEHNEKMIADGIHPFLDKAAARDRNLKRVNAGTHNLIKRADGSSQSSDRVKAGNHHFLNFLARYKAICTELGSIVSPICAASLITFCPMPAGFPPPPAAAVG